MSKLDTITDNINDTTKKVKSNFKNFMFDVVGIAIIIAMIAISLSAIKMREVTKQTIGDILVDVVPFYFAAILLSVNYYQKGVFAGKAYEGFILIVKLYSSIVNALDGNRHKELKRFCVYYNKEALKSLQVSYLEANGFTYEEFMYGNDTHKPFIHMTNKEIESKFGKEVSKKIRHAKKISIKGINVNILLGSYTKEDMTDLGPNELQLAKKRTTHYTISSIGAVLAITLISAKDIWEWGWMGAAIALFKLAFIICRAYMRYYEGYSDITVKFANHISRKSDILKEFNSWYDEQIENEDTQLHMVI